MVPYNTIFLERPTDCRLVDLDLECVGQELGHLFVVRIRLAMEKAK